MTIAYQFPSPANWQDFERLLQDLFRTIKFMGELANRKMESI